jgi:hypothetical protein
VTDLPAPQACEQAFHAALSAGDARAHRTDRPQPRTQNEDIIMIDAPLMPARIARLPRDRHNRPIPWFVATLPDGTRDFRIAGQEQHVTALRDRLCWICGGPMGAVKAFVIGPMCAVNRISSEPPAHRDCAIYAARVCPFLANPGMRRRPVIGVDGQIPAAGNPIPRNPGVSLVWLTRTYRVVRAPMGNTGLLCELGEPSDTLWYARGWPASRPEILASFEAGLPTLQESCQHDADPADSLRLLARDVDRALALVPGGPA